MARIGLVIGSGGVTGYSFEGGMLWGLHEATGWDPRNAELIVGTSSGSQIAAVLRAGLSPEDIVHHDSDEPPTEEGREIVEKLGPYQPMARPRPTSPIPSSPQYLFQAAFRPWIVHPCALLAAALPEGQVSPFQSVQGLEELFDGWPDQRLWICATDLDDGQRVVFGRPDAPKTDVATAVAASCALSGWHKPAMIEGRRFIDGSCFSSTHLDVVADEGLDLVIVLAPLSHTQEVMRTAMYRPLRSLYRLYLRQEAMRVRKGGATVVILEPRGDDLLAMGSNPIRDTTELRRKVSHQAYDSMFERLENPDVRKALEALTD